MRYILFFSFYKVFEIQFQRWQHNPTQRNPCSSEGLMQLRGAFCSFERRISSHQRRGGIQVKLSGEIKLAFQSKSPVINNSEWRVEANPGLLPQDHKHFCGDIWCVARVFRCGASALGLDSKSRLLRSGGENLGEREGSQGMGGGRFGVITSGNSARWREDGCHLLQEESRLLEATKGGTNWGEACSLGVSGRGRASHRSRTWSQRWAAPTSPHLCAHHQLSGPSLFLSSVKCIPKKKPELLRVCLPFLFKNLKTALSLYLKVKVLERRHHLRKKMTWCIFVLMPCRCSTHFIISLLQRLVSQFPSFPSETLTPSPHPAPPTGISLCSDHTRLC